MTSETQVTLADFAAVISYGGQLSFSPDGSELAYTSNADGQFNLWVLDTATGGSRQLTEYTNRAVRDFAWSPQGDQILFTADTEGDEKHQLYLIPAKGGDVVALTERPDVQFFLGAQPWSADGNYIAYAGNDREPTAQDLIIRETPTDEEVRPLADGRIYDAAAWSPDGKYLVAIDSRSNTDTRMVLLDVQSGERRTLLPEAEGQVFQPGPWMADGSGFWVLTDQDREFLGLAFYDITVDALNWRAIPEWDVEVVAASNDGRYLAWATNENGYSRLAVRDLATGKDLDLPELPAGTLKPYTAGLWFSPSGTQIALFMESPTQPANIWLVDLDPPSARKLTESWRRDLSEVSMVEPELVQIDAFDGRNIPAWLYRPHGNGPFPAVISIHGGPEYQERPVYAYRGFYQYLLSRGVSVLAPNIRGSTGYGKSYQKLIHRDLGGNDVKDFAVLPDFLKTVPWIDGDRIGLFGGSYGGFAVLTCISRLPEKNWAAAVDIVGPSNLVTMLRSFPPTWQEVAKQTFGDVETEEEDLLRRSPITYVNQIRAPLFVIQGANDPRVVQAESDQIVALLRSNGIAVKYDVYPDEGHGFTRKENELKGLGDSAAFLIEHLVPER